MDNYKQIDLTAETFAKQIADEVAAKFEGRPVTPRELTAAFQEIVARKTRVPTVLDVRIDPDDPNRLLVETVADETITITVNTNGRD